MAVTIPSFTKALLPNTPAAGDLARVTDNVQGAWMADGTTQASWFSLLGEVINVRDFGATGDGSTNDGPAIQAAINARTGIVYLPPGTYVCENAIALKDQLTIFGAGARSSVVKFTGNTRGFTFEPPPGTTGDQIRLSGFRIEGHAAALELVHVKKAAMLYFDELIIRDTNETCLYLENCYNIVMHHLAIEGADQYGIHLKGGEGTPTNVWSITGCNFQPHLNRVGLAALCIEGSGFGGVRDSVFEGGIVTDPPAGINTAILLKGATNVEVAANFMELFRLSVIDFRDAPSSGIRIALNAIHSGRNDSPENLVEAGSGLADFLIIEQNRFGGVAGGNCFNPGQTATFAYRMNFKDFSGGAHVFGFVESNVEKFPSAIRQKEARLLNEGNITGATPSVANLQYAEVNNSSAVTMTDLTGGARDQLVVLHFGNGNTTVQNGNLHLAGKANKTFAAFDTLTLLNVDGGSTWVEVCRSIN